MKKDKGQLTNEGPQAETGGPAPHGGQWQWPRCNMMSFAGWIERKRHFE